MAKSSKTNSELLHLARNGNVEELFAFAAEDPSIAYKWLLVAEDLGHSHAAETLGDIEEVYDDFKYDDDCRAKLALQLELLEDYFLGREGLEVDHELAKKHCDEFLDGFHESMEQARSQYLDGILEKLSETQMVEMEVFLARYPFRSAKRQIDRLQGLFDLIQAGTDIPTIIIESEEAKLQGELGAVIAQFRKLGYLSR